MPYREDNESEQVTQWPKWPILIGIRVAARVATSRHGIRVAWWATTVTIAFALIPFSLAMHGLRKLGGADPDRRDACKVVASAFKIEGDMQPLPMIAAVICAVLFPIWVTNIIVAIVA